MDEKVKYFLDVYSREKFLYRIRTNPLKVGDILFDACGEIEVVSMKETMGLTGWAVSLKGERD